jgi:HK97 family phage portal protein
MTKKGASNERSLLPNENDPASHPPASVGPPSYVPGEAGAVVFVESTPAGPWRSGPPKASPWSGWPAEWDTPNWWGQLNMLTDTAWACLDLNSSVMATMPPYLVGASPNLPDAWLDNPDPDLYTSWEEFAKQLFWDYQMGEAFVLATARYGDGWPARFHVVPPWTVNAEMGGDGTRRYRIGGVDVTADVLHIRYRSEVGDAHGHGPLEAGRARLIAGRVLTQYATALAETGAIPNAVLTHPDELTAEQATDLQTRWVEARLSKMGLPAVLSGGITFEALQLSPKDMALVELWQFNESRICILLGVPPFLMGLPSGGDSLTYSNVNSLFDFHYRASLRPKAQTVMAALSAWVTPRGTRVELNRDSYVQADPLVRAQVYEILNRIRDDMGRPVMTVTQIQTAERLMASIDVEGMLR